MTGPGETGPAVLLPLTPVQGGPLQIFLRLSYLTGRTRPRQGLAATFPTKFPLLSRPGSGQERGGTASEAGFPSFSPVSRIFLGQAPGAFVNFARFFSASFQKYSAD